MQKIELDGNLLDGDFHDYVIDAFNLPEYYGRNLDALYDCLCDICEETLIEITDPELADEALLETILDAAEDNDDNITVAIIR